MRVRPSFSTFTRWYDPFCEDSWSLKYSSGKPVSMWTFWKNTTTHKFISEITAVVHKFGGKLLQVFSFQLLFENGDQLPSLIWKIHSFNPLIKQHMARYALNRLSLISVICVFRHSNYISLVICITSAWKGIFILSECQLTFIANKKQTRETEQKRNLCEETSKNNLTAYKTTKKMFS